jgi:hypothetical protein
MRILVSYRGIPQSPGWATGDMVVKALRELGHEVHAYAKNYQTSTWVECHLLHPHLQIDYDLWIFMECNDGDQQYLGLKDVKTKKKVSWTFDNSYYPDNLASLLSYFQFDYHFLANPLLLNQFPNSHYLPYACDPELHSRSFDRKREHFCTLVGSIREDRKNLAKSLKKHNVDLKLIGEVFREEYIDTLGSSRIIVNQNPGVGAGLLNMRTFEAPAAGALLLMERRDYEANPGILRNNKDCIVFDSDSHLAELLSNLEKDTTGLVENLRMAGQSSVLSQHTYVKRCKQLLDIVNA